MARAPLVIAALFPLQLFAQLTSTVAGTVVDSTGSPVASARITARAHSGLERLAETDDAGTYSISNLPLQPYILSVEKDGFQVDRRPLTLRSNLPVEIDFRLSVVEQTASITVDGRDGAPVVDTEST